MSEVEQRWGLEAVLTKKYQKQADNMIYHKIDHIEQVSKNEENIFENF